MREEINFHREEFQISDVAIPAFKVKHNSPPSEWLYLMTCLLSVEYGKEWKGKFVVEKPGEHHIPIKN